MSLRLPRFQAGRPVTEEVTADKLNQLVDAIRQCELNSGVGYDVARGSGGSTLTIKSQTIIAGGPGAAQLIGPTNSGISHTNGEELIQPGAASYNFECRTPTGSYVAASVHGQYWGEKLRFNTNPTLGSITIEEKYEAQGTGVSISSDDTYRNIGLLVPHQAEVFDETAANTSSYASTCDAITSGNYVAFSKIVTCGQANDFEGSGSSVTGSVYGTTSSGGTLCSGTRYIATATCSGVYATQYYTFTSVGVTAAAGSFVTDNIIGEVQGQYVGTDPYVPGGVYFYRRTFLVPDSAASATVIVKVRIRLKGSSHGQSTINAVKVNGSNVGYAYFETPSTTLQPLEISDGFQAGTNTLEVGVQANNFTSYPTVSFEFLPTSAVVSALDNNDQVSDFIDLTEEQMDLIGQGTPVKALNGATAWIWSYKGTGLKNTSDSYDLIRQA